MDISEIKKAAAAGSVSTALHAQIESLTEKRTREQKPYYELQLVDAADRMTLRAWSDSSAFAQCVKLVPGDFVGVDGEFGVNGTFGLDAKRWSVRPLDEAEREALLAGPADLRAKQDADFAQVREFVAGMDEPRMRAVCEAFIGEFGDRFRRSAAARTYHHARRGGLVEHVGQMMRAADAICRVYPRLNRDLLLAGVLFHDCGKLWENCIDERGFTMPYNKTGELLGHIVVGIELVNRIIRQVQESDEAKSGGWGDLRPSFEDLRLHLMHLVGAHHGEAQFGSPVVPKTPEAFALHYIDNLDAKLEMVFAGYESAPALAPQIFERVRPLAGNLVAPLPAAASPGDTGQR